MRSVQNMHSYIGENTDMICFTNGDECSELSMIFDKSDFFEASEVYIIYNIYRNLSNFRCFLIYVFVWSVFPCICVIYYVKNVIKRIIMSVAFKSIRISLIEVSSTLIAFSGSFGVLMYDITILSGA